MGFARWKNASWGPALGLLLLVAGTSSPASGASETSAGDGRGCSADPSTFPAAWSTSETWAWGRICEGRAADFDTALGTAKKSAQHTDDRFGDARRMLGADFLRTILTREQFRGAIPPEGVRIQGAVFADDVDLRDAVLTRVLGISDSRFRGKVTMNRLRTPTSVSFNGSKFERELWLDSVRIGGNLVMTNGEFGRVVMKTARIDGDFAMSRSNVTGALNMNGATVGGNLFLKNGTFGEVNLTNAVVGRQLNTGQSTFNGTLQMGGLSTEGHLMMNDGTKFEEVVLRGARIGGQLSLSDAVFGGRFDGESMMVERDLHMVRARFDGVTDLPLISVGGSVDVGGAKLNALNLTGARVGNQLVFGAGGDTVRWASSEDGEGRTRSPLIILWDASVAGLVDDAGSWPEDLQMMIRDFRYERLTPYGPREEGIGKLRETSWYVAWLARDLSNSFQPYTQLARVLSHYGEDGKARDILVAGRERKRTQLAWWSPERWWLWALCWTIGYGYGAGELRALYWAVLFILFGGLIALFKAKPLADGEQPGFWYAIDMLLPGIQLNGQYRHVEMTGWPRYYFRVHRLVGYLLLFFVVAGLTGLAEQAAR